MSSQLKTDDVDNENTCVVCFKNVEIFSIGDCDHPVCYECSTRMRVLCRQNECPICRHDMQKVVFTQKIQCYRDLERSLGSKHLLDRKFKIIFENGEIQHAYNTLLAHVCSKCPRRHAFQSFNHLKDHMRKEHELFYCELCVDNLKILTHERRAYTRKELAAHRRQGDPDDRSHRGHPLCEFCDQRYMDNDELYRHLRRDHLFCHFCDADGKHQYYDSYDELRRHFREKHFLCEEGDCYDEKFTSAFRSEIDLKAHVALAHGRQMTKAAAKQARTLELAFTLKPRPRQENHYRRGGGRPISRYTMSDEEEEGAVGGELAPYHQYSSQPTSAFRATNDEFPSLGGTSIPTQQGLHFRKPEGHFRSGGSVAMTEKDFPALGSEGSASLSLRVNSVRNGEKVQPSNLSIQLNHRSSGVVATVSSSQTRNKDPFPALSSVPRPPSTHWKSVSKATQKNSAPSQPQHVQKQHQKTSSKSFRYDEEDFPTNNNYPALRGNVSAHIASLAANQWSSAREPEAKLSVNKIKPSQPPPKPPPPKTFHIEDDFPSLNTKFDTSCSFSSEPKTLNTKMKKESSISIPVDNNWTNNTKKPMTSGNISSDSDVGSKKGSKKKNNKCKLKRETSPQSVKIVAAKSTNNNEAGKKNKQKEGTKPKTKQIKIEAENLTDKSKAESYQEKKPIDNNTLERKRSELKIENLNGQAQQENNLNMNDFPSLGKAKMPPGFSSVSPAAVPPGFGSSSAPPPGFSITLNSIARPPSNGLTFTSSSGQNYPISSGDGNGTARVFSYVPPANVMKRNADLVNRVTEALGSAAGLEEFMQMSALYRQGTLSAESYYNHCKKTMGEEAINHIFPELLVLLPEIAKQQELWKVSEIDKGWKLMVCAACGQVVATTDFRHHQSTHSLENHFPVLANGVAKPSAWTSK